MRLFCTEEGAVFEFLGRRAEGLEAILRLPPAISIIAVSIAAAGAIIGIIVLCFRLSRLIWEYRSQDRVRHTAAAHRHAAPWRQAARPDARLRVGGSRRPSSGSGPTPPTDVPPLKDAHAAFAKPGRWPREKLWLWGATGLFALTALVVSLFHALLA